MAQQPEDKIVTKVKYAIKCAGGYSVKIHGTVMGENGTPDILACINGIFFAVEVKTPTGVASPKQLLELMRWSRSGAFAVIVTSMADMDLAIEKVRILRQKGRVYDVKAGEFV